MRLGDNNSLKAAAGLVAVAVLSATVGIAVSARMNPQGQEPGQGQGQGPGMMGRGMGMRGGPGGPGGGPGGGPLGFLGPGARALNLTDAQRDQIRTAVQAHQEDMKAIQKRVMTARKALDNAVTAEGFDEDAVRTAAGELAAAEADGAVLRARVHQAAFAVLTPEQKQKSKELKLQMEQRMKDGRGRGPGRMMDRFMDRPAPSQGSDGLSEQESGRPEVA